MPKENSTEVFRAFNGTPVENTRALLDLVNKGISLFDRDDIVIIKPNLQWFNQGAPNIAALEALVAFIFDRPGGFAGEVVIAENNHLGPRPWETGGWGNLFVRNVDLEGISNYNELLSLLKQRYGDRISACHWIDTDDGGKRVYSPADGPGYVLCDGTGGVPLLKTDNGAPDPGFRETIMSYPIFRTDRGTVIDFKDGVWEKGAYTGRQFKFFNLAALNHHSPYCGATSAVKNLFGVADLSGGSDPNVGGRLAGEYYNFHSFAFDKWAPGPAPGMVGRAVGTFMNTIRRPDLNITTAEWVGLASRTELPAAHTRAILASTDPVALDYHAAKYVLYANSRIPLHDPDRQGGPLAQYLRECANVGGCTLDETGTTVISYDVQKGQLQPDPCMAIRGQRLWGRDVKSLLKYAIFRCCLHGGTGR